MIVVLDYGMGNLRSVEKACVALGSPVSIQSDLAGATKVIIPGVGAFGAAMERLQGLKSELQAFANSGQPLLGICLGQQLLFEASEEHGEHPGLELVGGHVKYFPRLPGLKVPHMGWAPLSNLRGRFMDGTAADEQVYFVHSLYCAASDPNDVASTAEYGVIFPAAIESGNVWGSQFHPEKSGAAGLKMLGNFLKC